MKLTGKLLIYSLAIFFIAYGGKELLLPEDDPVLAVSWHEDPATWDLGAVCVGYNPESHLWGPPGVCPRGYAFIATGNPGGPRKDGPGEFVPVEGPCCPLPFDDILTDEHVYNVGERCPDNYVVTMSNHNCMQSCLVRCTKINTAKYQLAPERASYYWRFPDGGHYGQGDTGRVERDQVPAAIRHSLGRWTHGEWAGDGCVGVPFGALLVRKSKKTCDGFFHRQLQYKDGLPVPMFPKCDHVDKYDPRARCERAESPVEGKQEDAGSANLGLPSGG